MNRYKRVESGGKLCFMYDPFRRVAHVKRGQKINCLIDIDLFEREHTDPGYHRVECDGQLIFKYDVVRGLIDYRYRDFQTVIDLKAEEAKMLVDTQRTELHQIPPRTVIG